MFYSLIQSVRKMKLIFLKSKFHSNWMLFLVDTQAFCDDSFTVVSDSTSVNNRSNFASEFNNRLDDMQPAADVGLLGPHHRRRLQQQQRSASSSSPAADDDLCTPTHQRRTSSQDYDVDLSPADVDDNDSMQVQNLPTSYTVLQPTYDRFQFSLAACHWASEVQAGGHRLPSTPRRCTPISDWRLRMSAPVVDF